MRGRLQNFSLDRLCGFLNHVDKDVDVVIKPKPSEPTYCEQGGPAKSYGLILRSERVAGKVPQGNYDLDTGAYRRVEGPTNVPYEIIG